MNPQIVKSSNVVEFQRVKRVDPSELPIFIPKIKASRFYQICIESENILRNTQQHFAIPIKIIAPAVTEFVFHEYETSFEKAMMIGDCLDGNIVLNKIRQAIVLASKNETINASINAGKLELGDLYVKINMLHMRLIDYDL